MPIPVKFSKGLSSATPSEIEPGRFKLQIDTGTLIFDNDDSSGAQYPTVQVADPTKLPLTGGALTGELNLSSNKITGLAAPTANTDAATKSYVDSSIYNPNRSNGYVQGVTTGTSSPYNIIVPELVGATSIAGGLYIQVTAQNGLTEGDTAGINHPSGSITITNSNSATVGPIPSGGANSYMVYLFRVTGDSSQGEAYFDYVACLNAVDDGVVS